MKAALKRTIQNTLGRFDYRLVRGSYLDFLVHRQVHEEDLRWIAELPPEHALDLVRALPHSRSQLKQDLFVISALNFQRGGYFVEFGAADGIAGSNSHLLEHGYGWTGILAEPARCWHAALSANRACRIDTRCVWRASGETLTFNETDVPALSTIDHFSATDGHRQLRTQGHTYDVQTISLDDLLESHGAPKLIDYLSIDTEGSEFEILSHFDFDRRRFRVITCEHNFTPMREALHALLTSKGYVRTLQAISSVDDWYVSQELTFERLRG